jgi:hypothetical protein
MECSEGEKRSHHVVPNPGPMVGRNFPLVGPFASFFVSIDVSSPKINYIYNPFDDFTRSGRKTRNT